MCLAKLVPTSACSLTDTECLCTDVELNTALSVCVLQGCSQEDALCKLFCQTNFLFHLPDALSAKMLGDQYYGILTNLCMHQANIFSYGSDQEWLSDDVRPPRTG